MTLAIVLANADNIIQVSDRRLSFRGQIIDDAFTKVGHVICNDATFLYCFTGLATVGETKTTTDWLRETLRSVGQRGATYRRLDEGLAEAASKYFRDSPFLRRLAPSLCRLTIMLSGYSTDGFIVNSLISNFQNFVQFIDYADAQSGFTLYPERSILPALDNPTMVQAIGQFHALTTNDEMQLRQMLIERKPGKAIVDKTVALIQALADHPSTRGTIGKRLNTARLERLNLASPIVGYVSDIVESRFPLLDQVAFTADGQSIEIRGVSLSTSPSKPIVHPKVHRNAPCPCGSRKRFRECHGRR